MNDSTPAFRSSLLGLLLRRYWIVLAFGLLGALAGFALSGSDGNEPTEYESRALVVATTWELRIEGLSRMVDTVVETNGFRQEIQRADAEAFTGSADFEQSIEIVPVQDTVAVWLEARAGTPELAQRRANLAGDVLVTELNRLGDDIGTFVVQDRASLPTAPVKPELAMPIMIALGALGGLTIGTGVAVAWPDRDRRRLEATPARGSDDVDEDESGDEASDGEGAGLPSQPEVTTLEAELGAALRGAPDGGRPEPAAPANPFGPPRHRAVQGRETLEPDAAQRMDFTSRDRRGPTELVRKRA